MKGGRGRAGVDPDFMARVIVDGELLGDEAAADKHGISLKTVGRYRARSATDPVTREKVQALRASVSAEWAEQMKAEAARRPEVVNPADETLMQFVERTSPEMHLPIPWHQLQLVQFLERGMLTRVFGVIEMPPQHGKTTRVRQALAWGICKFPERTNAFGTYSGDYAKGHSRAIQDLVKSQGVKLRPRAQKLAQWETMQGGGLLAQGRKGQWTGNGFSGACVLDDMVKNREEAESKVIRDVVWNIITNDIWTRLNPPIGSLILVNTRWNADDPPGRLLDISGKGDVPKVDELNLPALRDPETGQPSDKPNAIALWPERYPVRELVARRAVMGPYAWNALYQGKPSPDEGNIFRKEWLSNVWITLPTGGHFVQSWDMAFSLLEQSEDNVVGQVWYVHGVNFYLVDQVCARMNFAETVDAMRAMTKKWPRSLKKLVESKANGPNVVRVLKREIPGLRLVAPADNGSKVSRARAVEGLFSAGNVFLPHPQLSQFHGSKHGAPWVAEYIRELLSFPTGGHDDQVDATTLLLNHVAPKEGARLKEAMRNVFAKRCAECGAREEDGHAERCSHAPKPALVDVVSPAVAPARDARERLRATLKRSA
jgi:predicted phage terminase large subunit-like protein